MGLSDEEVLLESHCFLLNHQEQITRKRKRTRVQEILRKTIEQGVYQNYCRIWVSMIENGTSSYLYNELFGESNEEQCTAFQSIVWSLIVQKNTMKNCSNDLQAFSFRSLSLFILHFLFHKGKNTSRIPQPSVQHLVYVFPIFFFVFINALITST